MPRFILSIGAFLITFTAFSQKPEIIEAYAFHDFARSLYAPWRKETVWIETLTLKDDQTFTYFMSSSCLPSTWQGTWSKKDNIISLKFYPTSPFMESIEYEIKKKRLYPVGEQIVFGTMKRIAKVNRSYRKRIYS